MIVRRRAFLSALAALALPRARVSAQSDGVDQAVRVAMDERHIPGVSLAIVKDGAIVTSAAYGRMRVSPDEPATPSTMGAGGIQSNTFDLARRGAWGALSRPPI